MNVSNQLHGLPVGITTTQFKPTSSASPLNTGYLGSLRTSKMSLHTVLLPILLQVLLDIQSDKTHSVLHSFLEASAPVLSALEWFSVGIRANEVLSLLSACFIVLITSYNYKCSCPFTSPIQDIAMILPLNIDL